MDNQRDVGKKTNLHHAVAERFTNLVQSLLEQGEKLVNVPDEQGRTPLHLACSNIKGGDLPLFLKCGSDYLPCRILNETEKIIELLLCHGADLQVLDKLGKSPLHCLVDHWLTKLYPIEKFKEIITQFLQCGANISVKDGNGRSVLHYVAGSADMIVPPAAPVKDLNLVDFICINARAVGISGPSGSANTTDEVTPENQLYRKELLVVLLNSGADINSIDNEGFTPLHLAIAANQFMVVKELLVGKPVVNFQNIEGQTPLHHALSDSDRFKHCGILLLYKGALASIVDKKVRSPFDFAKGLPEFATFLKHLILLMNEKMHPEMEIKMISERRNLLKEACMRECKDLKTYFAQNGQSQLHMILQSHRLPVYTRNDFFHSKISSDGFMIRFPLYAPFLKYKFSQDTSRIEMIDNCISVFSCFGGSFHYTASGRLMYSKNSHWEALPIVAKLQILSYLTNDDLEYLEKHLT